MDEERLKDKVAGPPMKGMKWDDEKGRWVGMTWDERFRSKESGPPYPDTQWDEKHGMWRFIDKRTPEEKARDEELAAKRKAERQEWEEKWRFLHERFQSNVHYRWPECGCGWLPIVKRLVERLDKIWEGFHTDFQPKDCWQVLQVKEKFAELRFYVNFLVTGSDDPVELVEDYKKRVDRSRVAISDAGAESAQTCETCGEPGERQSIVGWMYTFCKRHAEGTRKAKEEDEARYAKAAEERAKKETPKREDDHAG